MKHKLNLIYLFFLLVDIFGLQLKSQSLSDNHALSLTSASQLEKTEVSSCHIFIDNQIIWTMEVVEGSNQFPVPIVNVVTFEMEETVLRTRHIFLFNKANRTAEINRFSIETGFDPYLTNNLKILPSSFIGFDLKGNFKGFLKPTRVVIELGKTRYLLQAVECLVYEILASKINKINYDTPDVKEDFSVLQISHIGSKVLVGKVHR